MGKMIIDDESALYTACRLCRLMDHVFIEAIDDAHRLIIETHVAFHRYSSLYPTQPLGFSPHDRTVPSFPWSQKIELPACQRVSRFISQRQTILMSSVGENPLSVHGSRRCQPCRRDLDSSASISVDNVCP